MCIHLLYLYSIHCHFLLWLPQFLDQFLNVPQFLDQFLNVPQNQVLLPRHPQFLDQFQNVPQNQIVLLWLSQFQDQFLNLPQNQLVLDVFQIKHPRASLEVSVQLKYSLHIHVHQNYALLDSNFGSIHKIHFTNSNQMITKIIHFSMWNWKYMTKKHLLYCFELF